MDTKGKFYLGRIYDPAQRKTIDQPLLYDPADLTTHAVVVGMTGSGKTGLCINLLEEAALAGIPAMMMDPKGDMTNIVLHFPELKPQDFEPWIDSDTARRAGKTVPQVAEETAASWKQGLADWGIDPERIGKLQSAAQFTIYTPGSTAGVPINILASLKAPQLSWQDNQEVIREKISGTVTALLGLVGLQDLDPVRSREHILLSNIFENAWSTGKDLDLGEIIIQTQSPPFTKLGVFDVNTFFPEKDRFALAMLLNNILAAPSFQPWIQGQPLDIEQFMFAEDGRPKHSVLYLAHLSDSERMFFVTLFYSAVESWMRAQSGSSTLRAIVYFDEIYGYIPPVANPPSKTVILRMLKQARAFGVGQVLVTQNPVDIDYKGLSNAGTWWVGKLQTDQDKQRLLDGLESALPGGLNRADFDRLISTLGKRVFLMQNVHEKQPLLFQTRWAMNYLAGPLTRLQIPALNQLVNPQKAELQPKIEGAPRIIGETSEVLSTTERISSTSAILTARPPVPQGVEEYILPVNCTLSQALRASQLISTTEPTSSSLVYHPVLVGQATIRYFNQKYNLDYEDHKTFLVQNPDRRGYVRWDEFGCSPIDMRQLSSTPELKARYYPIESPLSDSKTMAAMRKDFLEWAYRAAQIKILSNEALKIFGSPNEAEVDFQKRCLEAAQKALDGEIKKIAASFDKKIKDIQTKIEREERELDMDQEELSQRRMEEYGTHAENLFGLLGGRRSSRRVTSSLSKHRMTTQAKENVEESQKVIKEYKEQIAQIEKEKGQALEEVKKKWGEVTQNVTEITLLAQKKDVLLEMFGLAWLPYYQVRWGDREQEVPAFLVVNLK